MSVESAKTIVDLSATWPLNGDPILEGDDHIRLLKSMLKTQFPGVGGQGFSIVITAKESEINFLGGVTSNIQTQINSNYTLASNAKDLADSNSTAIALKADKAYVDDELEKKAEKISTDAVFGGFKHTVIGTTLNLFTV